MKIDDLRRGLQLDLHASTRSGGNNDEARRFADDLAGQNAGLRFPVRVYVHLTTPLGQPATPKTVTVVGIWLVLLPEELADFQAHEPEQGVFLQRSTFAAATYYTAAYVYAVASDESLVPLAAATKDGPSGGVYFYQR